MWLGNVGLFHFKLKLKATTEEFEKFEKGHHVPGAQQLRSTVKETHVSYNAAFYCSSIHLC